MVTGSLNKFLLNPALVLPGYLLVSFSVSPVLGVVLISAQRTAIRRDLAVVHYMPSSGGGGGIGGMWELSIYPGLGADPHVSQLSVTFHSSMEFHWRLAVWGGGEGGV